MSGLTKIDDKAETYIGLTKADIEKYSDILIAKYNLQLKEIDNKFIGGCILENEPQGIVIDNTLLNKIDEKLKG